MEQILEKEEIYIIIPEIEEKAEKAKEKSKKIKQKRKLRIHSRKHQKNIDVNKIKNMIDASRYNAGFYNR